MRSGRITRPPASSPAISPRGLDKIEWMVALFCLSVIAMVGLYLLILFR